MHAHTHLVFLGNKVVYDEHLEPEFSAQLADILEEALDFSVMLLLQICHLTNEKNNNCSRSVSAKLIIHLATKNYLIKSEYTWRIHNNSNTLVSHNGRPAVPTGNNSKNNDHLWCNPFVKLTSDLAAISMVHTFFSFLVFPWASSCRLVYFSSISKRSCCFKRDEVQWLCTIEVLLQAFVWAYKNIYILCVW